MSLAPGLLLSLALALPPGDPAAARSSPTCLAPAGTVCGDALGHAPVRVAQRAASVREGVRRTKRLWRHETTGRGSRPASPLPPRATAPGDAPRAALAPAPLPPAEARRIAAPVPGPEPQPQPQPRAESGGIWGWLLSW